MRKIVFTGLVSLTVSLVAVAQKDFKATSSFVISGDVRTPATIQIKDLSNWEEVSIGDVTITNHLGEKKSDAKGLKGFLLKDVLSSVDIAAETPKVLSEYYIVCKATDSYTIVYSWNEIFNTAIGDSVYIITGKDGKPAASLEDSILMISTKDFKTGRRYLKALSSIEIKRVK